MAAVTIYSDFGAPKSKAYFYFIDYTKAFNCMDHHKLWKQCQALFWGAPNSRQIVTAAMKLKDAYSLEGK